MSGVQSTSALQVIDLERMSYQDAYKRQVQACEEVLRERGGASQRAGRLLLVEHDPPVITISRRRGARENLLATDAMLSDAGVEIAETDRGGDITYHGPGQLVVYPILDLNALGLNLHGYMRFLEDVIIDVCARFGVSGGRDAGATGVWANGRKICAIGVRVRRWVTMHGLALNVRTNLAHFDLIVPCGLTGRSVTSMERELGAGCPALEDVKAVVVEELSRRAGALLSSRSRMRPTRR